MQIQILVDSSELGEHPYFEVAPGVYTYKNRTVVLKANDTGLLIIRE